MASNKKYWKSEAELNPDDSMVETLKHNEFAEEIPVNEGFLEDRESLSDSSTNRRDFLKYIGFSTAAASLAACEGPVYKSIPYVVQPENIVPGVANYYATTIADGYDFASILIKTREGRPIKVENNTDANIGGGANARVQASVLSLYDSTRLQGPLANGEPIEWDALDAAVKTKLDNLRNSGKQIAVLTQTYASPSTQRLMGKFKASYSNVNHVTYDTISEDAALTAFEQRYGERALPDYDFEKAGLIISFGANFLADWQGGGYDASYARSRVPKNGKMSRHVQFEANMTTTGGKADKRVPLTPVLQKVALAQLYAKLNGSSVAGELPEYAITAIDSLVQQIKKNPSAAVVVSGIDDVDTQAVVLAINEMLGSKAFDAEAPKYTRQGNVRAVNTLIADMKAGKVGALIMDGVNPMYSLPNAADFKEGVENVDLTVVFSANWNETTEICQYTAAANHYLESWGDAQIKKGHYSLMQPTIRQLFDTRQFQDALLQWLGTGQSYYDFVKETWGNSILGGSSWNQALQDGTFESSGSAMAMENGEVDPTFQEDTALDKEEGTTNETVADEAQPMTATPISSSVSSLANATSGGGMELILYSKIGMGDGRQANNPWLQEFSDPITRVSWDNYLMVSKADAERLGLVNDYVANGALNGSYAKLTVNGITVDQVPVIVQPGQARGSVGLAFGYGKKVGMKEEMQVGVNAFPLYQNFSKIQSVKVEKAAGMHEFACEQLQSTMVGRSNDIIKETTLEIFNSEDKEHWNAVPEVDYNHSEIEVREENADIWQSFDSSIGPHFNMSIDLNACTACGQCVIACQAENNVPVVGKKEVRRFRDMKWLRIDRYYSSAESFEQEIEDLETLPAFETYAKVENPSFDNPEIAFQPVMCQHCNHAPCETVCPVAAISHGRQGQNQMVYNRCVGTRYCANNCPYKVRRFNWFLYNNNDEFDYHMNNDLGKMVLNPDVTTRSRGVMEKCSMCIQKTQKTILDAKRDGRTVKDGEFQTACSLACDKGAIVFGDVNDESAEIVQKKNDDRMYHLLESLGTKPNVMYQLIVKNTAEA